ncbi:hypothetical protein ACS7SF_25160 (plasmid) [Ralstonia sp. 25C]
MTSRQMLVAYVGGLLWGMALIVGAAVTVATVARDVLRAISP